MDYRYQRNGDWPPEESGQPGQSGQPMQPVTPASATPLPQAPYPPYASQPRQQRWPAEPSYPAHPAYLEYPALTPLGPSATDAQQGSSAFPPGAYPPSADTTGAPRLEQMTTSPIQYAPPPYAPDMLNGASSPAASHAHAISRGNDPWDDDDGEEQERSITARMARLRRDPQYETAVRKLANRRRARSLQSELLLVIDLAITITAALLIGRIPEQFVRPALHFLHLSLNGLAFSVDLPHLMALAVWMILLLALGADRKS